MSHQSSSTIREDHQNDHENEEAGAIDEDQRDQDYSLHRHQTQSQNSMNLSQFPSFPHERNVGSDPARRYQTAHTRRQEQPKGAPRESFLSTHPSLWPVGTFDLDGQPVYTRNPGGTWVDPDYVEYHSGAGWPKNEPLWGLARPFARIVRNSVRRPDGEDEEEKTFVEPEQRGDVEAALQVSNIPTHASNDHSSSPPEQERRTRGNSELPSAGGGSTQHSTTSARLENHQTNQRRSQLAGRQTGPTRGQDQYDVDVPSTVSEDQGATDKPEEKPHEEVPQGATDKPEEKPHEEVPHEEEKSDFATRWAWVRFQYRRPLAEFLATTIGLLVGYCGNLTVVTTPSTSALATSSLTGPFSWGLGIMTAIYVGGGISGAHLNPAVSLMLSLFRGFPLRFCYQYIIAQFLGALTAAGIAFALYRDAIANTNPGNLDPASTGIYMYTQPKAYVSQPTAFFNEFVGSAVLGCTILALGDDTNAPPGAGMNALILGLVVMVLSLVFSTNTEACLNPFRDFCARLVASMAGYGHTVWTAEYCWWIWGPWVADVTGIMVGAFVYDAFIFVGGESPVNFPARRRRKLRVRGKAYWARKMVMPKLQGQGVAEKVERKKKHWEDEAERLAGTEGGGG